MSENYINNYAVTVASNIDNVSTSLTVSAAASIAGGFRVKIDTELLQVTSGGTTTTWTVVRGVESTTAASHTTNTPIYVILTAGAFDAVRAEMTQSGVIGSIPSGKAGDLYFATDTIGISLNNGSGWTLVGPPAFLSGSSDPGVPSIAVVQAASAVDQNTSKAFVGSVTSGNLLIAAYGAAFGAVSSGISVADTQSSSWTQVTKISQGGGSNGTGVALFWAIAAGSGSETISFSGGGGGGANDCMAIMEISGNFTSTVDTFGSQLNSGPPTITASIAYDIMISAMYYNSTSAASVTTPEVLETNGLGSARANSIALSMVLDPSSGSFTSSLTAPGGSAPAVVTAAFKAQAITSPGNDGDWYLNLSDGVLWGPKTSGVWAGSGWQLTAV